MRKALTTIVAALALATLLILAACSQSGDPETVEFDLTINDAALEAGAEVYRVKNGDTVILLITSDEAGSLHVHGYNREQPFDADTQVRMEFVADVEGRFAMAFHPLGQLVHTHASGSGEPDNCPDTSHLHAGVEPPQIEVQAEPGENPGEMNVTVDLDNFHLALSDSDVDVAQGHWHLYVDGEIRGMYVFPDAQVSGLSAGHHDVRAELTGLDHCYLDISASTMVMLDEGSAEGSMDSGMNNMDHSESEEAVVGFLEVLPR